MSYTCILGPPKAILFSIARKGILTKSEKMSTTTSDATIATKPRRRELRQPESKEELADRFRHEESRRQALVRREWMGADGGNQAEEEEAIHSAHLEAIADLRLSYPDPATGLKVLTGWNHFLRGTCCGSACRHCIYGHRAVPVHKRGRKRFNSAFWIPVNNKE